MVWNAVFYDSRWDGDKLFFYFQSVTSLFPWKMLQWRNYPVIKSNQIHQLGRRWGEVEKRKTQYHHSLAIVSKLWQHQNRWQRRRWRLLDRRGREARSHLQSRHREGSRKGGDKKVQAYLLPRPHGWLPNTSLWSAVFKSLRGLLVIMDPERKGCNPEAPLPPHTHTHEARDKQWCNRAGALSVLYSPGGGFQTLLVLLSPQDPLLEWFKCQRSGKHLRSFVTIIAGSILTDFPAPGSQAQAMRAI